MNCLKIIKSRVLPNKVMANKTHVRDESSPKVPSLYHWPGGLFSSDSVSFPSLDKETRIAICRGWEATGCSGKVVVSESEGLGVSPRPQRWPRRSVSVSEKRQPS